MGEDGVAMENCAECEIPMENSTSAVAYYLSLDCRKVCPPPPCIPVSEIMKPELIEEYGVLGMDLELPGGAVTVKDGTGDSVTVVVKNLWDEAANISAFHYVNDLDSNCDPRSLLPVGDTLEFDVHCFEGSADFHLYLYFGEDGVAMENCA